VRLNQRVVEKQNPLTGKVVVEFDLAIQVVGGGPGFSEGDPIGLISILGFKVTNNGSFLVVTLAIDFEGLERQTV
jgi:hypothetical protein